MDLIWRGAKPQPPLASERAVLMSRDCSQPVTSIRLPLKSDTELMSVQETREKDVFKVCVQCSVLLQPLTESLVSFVPSLVCFTASLSAVSGVNFYMRLPQISRYQ